MTSKWIIDITQEQFFDVNADVVGFRYAGRTSPADYEKYTYINTVPLTELNENSENLNTFYIESYGNILNITVYDKCIAPFNIFVDVWAVIREPNHSESVSYIGTIERQYIPTILKKYEPEMERFNKMINSNVSFQLLRANPKLTGNIKVVVTEDSKLYLDTFKVSLALGQYKYRHIPINPEEYYGRSVMHFRKMSTKDFYKVEDKCFNLFTAVNDYKMQYYTTYNSGVRTNEDHLYTENFALLAPLCIKDVIPDFFLVFKINTDELERARNMSEGEKVKYFFKNGKLLKSFDFRDGTDLGKYIRSIRSNAIKYPGDIFASYDTKNYNKFTGISLDRGVVTSAYESLFKEKNINNQVAFNEYFTLGFERNKLVSKDIVNFEFMFNDTEERLFSINTYFGIYVKLNGESDTFSCIGHDGHYVFDSSLLHNIPAGTEILEDRYPDLIYGVSTLDSFIRLKKSIYDSSVMEDYKLKPYRSIIEGEYHNIGEQEDYEFITVSLEKGIKVSEHYRIIDLKDATIYDVVSTKYTKYLENNLSEVCCNYFWYRRMRFTIKTVSAYFEGDLENQIDTLRNAFNKLKIENTIIKTSQNALSIKTYINGFIFEKVSSEADYVLKNKNGILDSIEDSGIMFFGHIIPNALVINANDVSFPDNNYFYLYPYYTEGTGYRVAYAMNFVKVSNDFLNNTVISENIGAINNKTVVYIGSDDSRNLYTGFDINIYSYQDSKITENAFNVNYILSPDLKSYIINVNNPRTYNDIISLYTAYPLNSGLCSILPVKDFYFDVLDRDTIINYFTDETKKHITSNGGEFLSEYMRNDVPVLSNTEEYVTDYFDKHRLYDLLLYTIDSQSGEAVYNKLATEQNKNDYYFCLLNANHLNSDISLTSPYVCKWSGVGSDARGERMRIMYSYDASNMQASRSYYIPYDSNDILVNSILTSETRLNTNARYNTALGYIETPVTSNYIKYIPELNGCLLKSGVNEEGISIKDAVLNGRISIDDIIYYASKPYNKFSTVYKAGENTVEFISGGIKIKIRSSNSDVIDFNTYNGFQAVLISIPGFSAEHNVSTELIIDEVNRQMALLWYTGANAVEPDLITSSNIFKILHTSPLYESKCIIIDNERCLQTPNDTGISSELCENSGFLILTNKHAHNNTEYSRIDDVMIVSRIDHDTEFTYRDASFILTREPYITANGVIHPATNELISLYTDLYHDGMDMYIVSDSPEYDINAAVTKEDLKTAVTNCGIYVRKQEGVKDYTNLDSLLTFSIVSPYKVDKNEIVKKVVDLITIENRTKRTSGYVQTSYGIPLMKDMIEFNYQNSSINSAFNTIFDGMNVSISDAKPVTQTWINKYTVLPNYCIPIDSSYPRLSVDCVSNISMFNNCWNSMYYEYKVHDFIEDQRDENIEWAEPILGYSTGYEKNNFFGSRGIVLNGSEGNAIDLTVWKNTKISEKEKYIKLNISESIVYKILFTRGFSDSWRYLGLRSNTHKIKYINNTILPLLNITSNTVFTLYMLEGTSKLMFKDLTTSDNLIEIHNVRNELKYENGKYYMYVYPDEMHTYYAKMHINL